MSQLLLALARRERLLRSPQSEDPSARTSFGDEALTLEKVRQKLPGRQLRQTAGYGVTMRTETRGVMKKEGKLR